MRLCKLLEKQTLSGCSCTCSWCLSFTVQLLINLLEWLSVNSDKGQCANHADGKTNFSKSARSAARRCTFPTTCTTLLELRVIAWPVGCIITRKRRLRHWSHTHILTLSWHNVLVRVSGWKSALHAFAVDFKPHLFSNYAKHSEIKIFFPQKQAKKR